MRDAIILFVFCLIIQTQGNTVQSKLECKSCHLMVEAIRLAESLAEPEIKALLKLIANSVCLFGKIQDIDVCRGAVGEMTPVIWNGIRNRYLDADWLCPLINKCPQVYEELKLEDYVNRILSDKPKNNDWPQIEGSGIVDIFHMSDIHTDLSYKEGTKVTCTKPICCREEYGPGEGDDAAGYWGTSAVCDLPERTVQQMINYIRDHLYNPNRKTFIVWTGDSAPHDIWKQGTQYNIQNSKRITDMFKASGLNIEFIPQVGNHEAFPVNEYDYMAKSDNGFRKAFADMWRSWIGDEAADSFLTNGYYKREFDNIKFVAFDSQVCNSDNWFLLKDPTDPTHFLEWLEQELRKSEAKNQAVYISAHIMTSSALTPWARRFTALVERFSRTIRNQIYGHAHGEYFNLYRDGDDKAVNVAYISSSMTTYTFLTPSFRKFEVDAKTYVPINYFQYRLDLKKANSQPRDQPLKWDLAFDFLTEYNLASMRPTDVQLLVKRVLTDQALLKKLRFNHRSGQSYEGNSAKGWYCDLNNSVDEDRKLCEGQVLKKEWTDYISPGWRRRIQ